MTSTRDRGAEPGGHRVAPAQGEQLAKSGARSFGRRIPSEGHIASEGSVSGRYKDGLLQVHTSIPGRPVTHSELVFEGKEA